MYCMLGSIHSFSSSHKMDQIHVFMLDKISYRNLFTLNVELSSKSFFFGTACLNGDLTCWFARETGFGDRNIMEEGVRAPHREELLKVKSYLMHSNHTYMHMMQIFSAFFKRFLAQTLKIIS